MKILTEEEQKAVNRRFLAAAMAGDLAKVKAAYAEGAQLEARDANKSTALILAAWNEKDAVVKFLLEQGADVNAQNQWLVTALFSATVYGYAGIVKQLLEAGADVNLQTNEGNTTLTAAAWCHGRDQIVELLLACGADIAMAGKYGNAVATANNGGYPELAARLQEMLDDPNKRPTLESVELDMGKRNAALAKLDKPAAEVHNPQTEAAEAAAAAVALEAARHEQAKSLGL